MAAPVQHQKDSCMNFNEVKAVRTWQLIQHLSRHFYNKNWLLTICFYGGVTEFCSGLLLHRSVSKLAWHTGRDCSDATHTSIMPVPNDLTTCWVSLLYFFPLLYTELNKITVPVHVSCSARMYPRDFTLYRNSQRWTKSLVYRNISSDVGYWLGSHSGTSIYIGTNIYCLLRW